MSTASLFISSINFKLLIETDRLTLCSSPEIRLNQIPWQVKVSRRSIQREDFVDVFLVCTQATTDSDWTCDAKATFTLESIGAEQQPHEMSLPMAEFSKVADTKGIAPFTTWAEFIKYARNGEVRLNVQLASSPILYMTPTKTVHFGATFRHTINNINQLTTENTEEIQLGGTRWYVGFLKTNAHLGVFLYQIRDRQNENWAWETKCSFTLQSFGRNVQPVRREMDHCFTFTSRRCIDSQFIELNDLLDPVKKYVKDDAIIFEVDLKVGLPKSLWDIGQEPSINDSSEQTVNNPLECPICLQNVMGRRPVITKCGHLFCEDCINSAIEVHQKCSSCNATANQTDLRHIHLG